MVRRFLEVVSQYEHSPAYGSLGILRLGMAAETRNA